MNDSELIEKYLREELPEEQKTRVDERIKSDPAFAELVEDHKYAEHLIHAAGLIDIKTKLQHIHNNKSNAGQSGKSSGGKYLLSIFISTLIVGIIAAGYFLKDLNKKTGSKHSEASVVIAESKITQEENQQGFAKETSSTVKIKTATDKSTVKAEENKLETKSIVNSEAITQHDEKKLKETTDVLSLSGTTHENKSQENNLTNGNLKDPCAGINIGSEIMTEESCEGKSEGRIQIRKTAGGKGPYNYSLNGNPYTSSENYYDLPGGEYIIVIKDANGCEKNISTEIKSKKCLNTAAAFAPDSGENWDLPIEKYQNCTIRLFNSKGMLANEIRVLNGFPAQWNGKDNLGNDLPAGAYLYEIIFESGNTLQGSVSIIR